MKIDHVAIWVENLGVMKDFYATYFNGTAGEKYHNRTKNFESFFLSFQSGTRLEIMKRPDIPGNAKTESMGFTHLAISVGSKENVDELTERLRRDGFTVAGEPRTTGDGYYESVILDPEGNRIEITI